MPTLWRVTVLWPQRGTGPTLRLSRREFDGAGTASNMPNEPAVKRRLDWLWHEFRAAAVGGGIGGGLFPSSKRNADAQAASKPMPVSRWGRQTRRVTLSIGNVRDAFPQGIVSGSCRTSTPAAPARLKAASTNANSSYRGPEPSRVPSMRSANGY